MGNIAATSEGRRTRVAGERSTRLPTAQKSQNALKALLSAKKKRPIVPVPLQP